VSVEPKALYERGKAAWPGVALDADVFAARCAELDHEPHTDLYLACACTDGAPAAVAAFERHLIAEVPAYIARLDASAAFADEVRQRVRDRLLVAPEGDPPRIADYAGRGPLGAWVRVVAVRVALDLLRERGSAGPAADELVPALRDPALDLVQARYRDAYQGAIRAALASLTSRERNVLRMHFVARFGIDAIGKTYRIHRATAARWIERAQDKLAAETYRLLGEQLQLSHSELDSIAGAVISQLHVSIGALLSEDA
jgi:RNA polymerase sigma-70 factor (ECF subfamily)